jgi:hypothetical protein
MKRLPLLVMAFFSFTIFGWAQVTSPFALSAQPVVAIPLGPKLSGGTPIYTIGGGASLAAEYTPAFAPYLFGGLGLDASFMPLNSAGKAATFLSLAPKVGVQFFPFPRFGIRLSGFGGVYAGMIEAGTILDPVVGGTLDFGYQIKPALAVTLGSTFSCHFTNADPALLGLGVTAGVRYYIGGSKADLKIEPDIKPIFPVFFNHYKDNPLGTVTLRNASMGPIENVRVSLSTEYISDQQWSPVVPVIQRGTEIAVDLNALFTTRILTVLALKDVAGKLTVDYKYFGTEMSATLPVTLKVQARNAMTWEKTEHAASFVTRTDGRVTSFAGPFAGDAGDPKKVPSVVSPNFRKAVALLEAMRLYGIGYVTDPSTPYVTFSKQEQAVDQLRFPVETLASKSGDCDDLSILYTSLLESVTVSTAFITVPGHIFTAFDLGIGEQNARNMFNNPSDLIYREDGTWLPVEVTLLKDGFLKAWKKGAEEWAEGTSKGTAEFVPIEPVQKNSFPAADTGDVMTGAITPPEQVNVYRALSTRLIEFQNDQTKEREAGLLAAINKAPNDARLINRLGVLYAWFGMLDKARPQFQKVLDNKSIVDKPAYVYVNLGNLDYLEGKYQAAFDNYSRALQKSAESVAALEGKLRTAYELKKDADFQDAYEKLKKVAPEIAKKYVEVAEGRAKGPDKEVSTWSE